MPLNDYEHPFTGKGRQKHAHFKDNVLPGSRLYGIWAILLGISHIVRCHQDNTISRYKIFSDTTFKGFYECLSAPCIIHNGERSKSHAMQAKLKLIFRLGVMPMNYEYVLSFLWRMLIFQG